MDEKQFPAALSVPVYYFDQPGPDNTGHVLDVVAEAAEALNIEYIVVASTTGRTGALAVRRIRGRNIVVVTHSAGFAGPNTQELDPSFRAEIEQAGAAVLTCQHAFGGVGRAVRKKLGTYELEEIIAHTLRIFGQGTKVAVEIALMAADAGLVTAGAPCISVGGTDEGADTALLLKPANAQAFFDLRIMEVLCKPRLG